MKMRFEEPRHLTALHYKRVIAAVWPALIVYGAILSALVLFKLWRLSSTGQHVALWNWLGGIVVGPLAIILLRFAWSRAAAKHRWIEFRQERLFLSDGGSLKLRRVLGWSLTADKLDSTRTQLKITYKFGFARHCWSMLLDDAAQISELRHALAARFLEIS